MSIRLPSAVSLAALAVLSLPLAACAGGSRSQRAADMARQRFAAADLDHDGYLSPDEAKQGMPRLAAHFGEIDGNHDGRLSAAEILDYLRQRRAAR